MVEQLIPEDEIPILNRALTVTLLLNCFMFNNSDMYQLHRAPDESKARSKTESKRSRSTSPSKAFSVCRLHIMWQFADRF